MATILEDDNFKCIFLTENDGIPIQISLKCVPRSPIDNKPALVQVMAPNRRQAVILTNVYPIHLCIYAALWVIVIINTKLHNSSHLSKTV